MDRRAMLAATGALFLNACIAFQMPMLVAPEREIRNPTTKDIAEIVRAQGKDDGELKSTWAATDNQEVYASVLEWSYAKVHGRSSAYLQITIVENGSSRKLLDMGINGFGPEDIITVEGNDVRVASLHRREQRSLKRIYDQVVHDAYRILR